jgi:hypothetical protein
MLKIENFNDETNPKAVGIVYEGLIFRATGNYGSEIFDPVPDNGFIEIVICDECLLSKKEAVTRVKNIQENDGKFVADISMFDPYTG